MLKVLCAGLAAGCLAATAALAAAPDLTFTAKFAKLSVMEKVGNDFKYQKAKDIWQSAQFQAALEQLMGKEHAKASFLRWSKSGMAATNPIYDDPQSAGVSKIYSIQANRSHDAGRNLIIAYVNLGRTPNDPMANTMQVFLCSAPGETAAAKGWWFATGQAPKALPASACGINGPQYPIQAFGSLKW